MQGNEDYFLIGVLAKTHGVKGELVLRINNLQSNEIKKMESVFIEIDGLMVPFFISDLFAKNSESLVIKFDTIHDEDQAAEFINCRVFSTKLISPEADTILALSATFIGYRVIDQKHGNIGTIAEFLNMPDNPLFRVIKNRREIFIPVNEEFILEIDDKEKVITIETPEGLIDLYTS